MYQPSCKYVGIIAAAIATVSLSVQADPLKEAIKTELQTQNSAIKSQKKIDKLSDQTRSMLEQYRSATRQTETLRTYNNHMRQLIASQEQEKQSLQKQLQDIEITQREILPLALNMLDSLEKFIQLDLPFLAQERNERLTKLKDMMVRADITHAEKFRRILEAYQIENDYGNSIEVYRGELDHNDSQSVVDYLRLGRVALYYQSLDGNESGFWDNSNGQWQPLGSEYRNAIRNGIRIARKEAAPDLLRLPLPAAGAVQ